MAASSYRGCSQSEGARCLPSSLPGEWRHLVFGCPGGYAIGRPYASKAEPGSLEGLLTYSRLGVVADPVRKRPLQTFQLVVVELAVVVP